MLVRCLNQLRNTSFYIDCEFHVVAYISHYNMISLCLQHIPITVTHHIYVWVNGYWIFLSFFHISNK
jgi:hypothetical protein